MASTHFSSEVVELLVLTADAAPRICTLLTVHRSRRSEAEKLKIEKGHFWKFGKFLKDSLFLICIIDHMCEKFVDTQVSLENSHFLQILPNRHRAEQVEEDERAVRHVITDLKIKKMIKMPLESK